MLPCDPTCSSQGLQGSIPVLVMCSVAELQQMCSKVNFWLKKSGLRGGKPIPKVVYSNSKDYTDMLSWEYDETHVPVIENLLLLIDLFIVISFINNSKRWAYLMLLPPIFLTATTLVKWVGLWREWLAQITHLAFIPKIALELTDSWFLGEHLNHCGRGGDW